MYSLKEQILDILAKSYPTGLSVGQLAQEVPGAKKPSTALVQSVLNEMLDDGDVEVDRQKGLWYVG